MDKKYDKMIGKMQAQTEYFEENKTRFLDCLDKLEDLNHQCIGLEKTSESNLAQLRDELDYVNGRINTKDKTVSDLGFQVIDIEDRVCKALHSIKDVERSVVGEMVDLRGYLQVV